MESRSTCEGKERGERREGGKKHTFLGKKKHKPQTTTNLPTKNTNNINKSPPQKKQKKTEHIPSHSKKTNSKKSQIQLSFYQTRKKEREGNCVYFVDRNDDDDNNNNRGDGDRRETARTSSRNLVNTNSSSFNDDNDPLHNDPTHGDREISAVAQAPGRNPTIPSSVRNPARFFPFSFFFSPLSFLSCRNA